jgi:RNA polymerase sigma-70 factor, ECF subfamily
MVSLDYTGEVLRMLEPTPRPASLDARRVKPGPGTDALPDLLLIERARAGEQRAIEVLIRRYCRRLYRVAHSVLWDDERAEAAVLAAYLAAFGDLSRYEPTGKFAAWLTRLTFNQARGMQPAARAGQAGRVRPGAFAAEPSSAEAAGGELAERRELEAAVSQLPEVFRTVYVLRTLEGMSGIETAASLGLHETTVRTRLFRAHRRLAPGAARRLRAIPGLLEMSPEALERVVSGTLARLAQGPMLAASTP